MAIPMRQSARIGWYLISKKIRRVEKFPLIGGQGLRFPAPI